MKGSTILIVSLFFVSSLAMAESKYNSGWYAGIGAGTTHNNNHDSLDESSTSVTGLGGYRFNKYLAIQGNFVDLGKYDGTGSVLKSLKLKAITFTAVGILPIGSNGIELYGRLGLGVLTYTQTFDLFGAELENSSSGDSIVSAVGVSYTPVFFQKMSIYLGYEDYYFETKKSIQQ